jgi:hypothetical protein
MDVTIGRCTADDIDEVLRFIDEYWKRGHILTVCPALLNWQHRDEDGSGYSFVLARRLSDGAVLGTLGYIATKRFDPALANANVLWLTTWRVRDDAGSAGLGIRLLQHVEHLEPHVAVGAIGVTPSTLPIYQAFRFATGELQHYVRPNERVSRFALASLQPRAASQSRPSQLSTRRNRPVTHDDFDSLRMVLSGQSAPAKSAEYFRQRYAAHPIYRYSVDAVSDSTGATLLVTRVAEHDDHRALRIVDFAGTPEAFSQSGPLVQSLLDEFDAEYADVYISGMPVEALARAGFWKVDPEGAEIVPDHFEPFERRNVRLFYAMKGGHTVLFKGDGDQDRPNQPAALR